MFNHYFSQTLTVMGTVGKLSASSDFKKRASFELHVRNGDIISVYLGETTSYQTLTNLDGVNRDRYRRSKDFDGTPDAFAKLYLTEGNLVVVEGIYQRHKDQEGLEARVIHLLQQAPDGPAPGTLHAQEMALGTGESRFYFEVTYWWINQIQRLADQWLDDLFKERRDYQLADFAALYRTNLNILGLPTDDDVQEMATLSRLIYGLSSAFLLTGVERYFWAAKAGVAYQREAFRGSSADGRYCFWSAAKRKQRYSTQYVMTSQNDDDKDTIPLYEQIYALAGLAQYYRITADHEVLDDIRRTVRMFQDFFHDKSGNGGYYSHLDYVTFSPKDPSLTTGNHDNRARKNWNSIGDHIPAYLVNLVLALDPPPQDRPELAEFLKECKQMLTEVTDLICERFADRENDYVRERFHEDWAPDDTWGWQQDRAIVGHNLKIAWNLTRVANYFLGMTDERRARKCMELADTLGQRMATRGLDPIRGGCFDAVQRHPANGMPIEFAWGNTKDFWQQEQGILAYLILHGNSQQSNGIRDDYLRYAREMMAFWNLFFLDRDKLGVFFRTTENGQPVISGGYGQKAGHSIAGYHSFELNYFAHIYLRSFVERPKPEHRKFTLYFRPDARSQPATINVLPDFYRPGTIAVTACSANGRRQLTERKGFQIELQPQALGTTVAVEFQPR